MEKRGRPVKLANTVNRGPVNRGPVNRSSTVKIQCILIIIQCKSSNVHKKDSKVTNTQNQTGYSKSATNMYDQGRFSLFVVSDRKNARYEEFFRTEKILFLDEGIAF